MSNPTIDNGVCTACDLPVTYDEDCTDDEVCIRAKTYCTKSEDEHVDWRATCKHVQACALKAESELRKARADIEELRAALDRLTDDPRGCSCFDQDENAPDCDHCAGRKLLDRIPSAQGSLF